MDLLDALTSRWKSASRGKKLLWLALAILAVYLIYKFKRSREKMKVKQNNRKCN